MVSDDVSDNSDCDNDDNIDFHSGHSTSLRNKSIGALCDEIKVLQETVSSLTKQVSFLLSFLGIKDDFMATDIAANTGGHVSSDQPAVVSTQNSVPSNMAAANSATTQLSDNSTPAQVTNISKQLTQNLVTAVYVDLNERESRKRNIVLSGFPAPDANSKLDFSNVTNFLNVEFDEYTDCFKVVSCRRLGKPIPGRFQPLRVTFETTEQARYFIDHAKHLRNSSNQLTRNAVYINADLTQAEQRAAYEIRCRRREIALNRQTRTFVNSALHVDHAIPSTQSAGHQGIDVSSLSPSTAAPAPTPHTSISAAPGATGVAGDKSCS
jgi:hypothetical protein